MKTLTTFENFVNNTIQNAAFAINQMNQRNMNNQHLEDSLEDINASVDEPQIDDYVFIQPDEDDRDEDFDYTEIGQIIDIDYDSDSATEPAEPEYKVQFENDWYFFTEDEILFYSPNKHDVETYIQAHKYNL